MKKLILGLCALFSLNTLLYSARLEDVYGFYELFKKDKKHLSPLFGALGIETGYLEKMYRFGNVEIQKKKRGAGGFQEVPVGGDATIILLRHFFNTVESMFLPTELEGNVATYCNSKTIGQLLNIIEEFKESSNKSNTQKLHDDIFTILSQSFSDVLFSYEEKEVIALLRENANVLCQGVGKNYAPFKKSWTETSKDDFNVGSWVNKHLAQIKKGVDNPMIVRASENVKKAFNDIRTALKSKDGESILEKVRKETNKNVMLSAKNVTTCMLQALRECGIIQSLQEPLYLEDTVHKILLGHLYSKAKSRHDIKEYMKQLNASYFDKSILEKEFSDKNGDSEFTHVLDKCDSVTQNQFLSGWSDDYKNSVNEFLSSDYENLIHALLSLRLENGRFIPLQKKWNRVDLFHDKESAFQNCSEIVYYNYLLVALTQLGCINHEKGIFDLSHLEESVAQRCNQKGYGKGKVDPAHLKEVIEFFKKYPSLYEDRTLEWHNDWTRCVSNIPGAVYLRSVNTLTKDSARADQSSAYIHEKKGYNHLGQFTKRTNDYFLMELAGYPENLLFIIEKLLGLSFDTFSDFCSFFDIHGSDLHECNNRIVYDNGAKTLRKTLTVSLPQDKKFSFNSTFTTGHIDFAHIDDYNKNRAFGIMSLVVRACDVLQENLIMLVQNEIVSSFDLYKNKDIPLNVLHHRFFCKNIFDKDAFISEANSFLSCRYDHVKNIVGKRAREFLLESLQNDPKEVSDDLFKKFIENGIFIDQKMQEFFLSSMCQPKAQSLCLHVLKYKLGKNMRQDSSDSDKAFYKKMMEYVHDVIDNNTIDNARLKFIFLLIKVYMLDDCVCKNMIEYGLYQELLDQLTEVQSISEYALREFVVSLRECQWKNVQEYDPIEKILLKLCFSLKLFNNDVLKRDLIGVAIYRGKAFHDGELQALLMQPEYQDAMKTFSVELIRAMSQDCFDMNKVEKYAQKFLFWSRIGSSAYLQAQNAYLQDKEDGSLFLLIHSLLSLDVESDAIFQLVKGCNFIQIIVQVINCLDPREASQIEWFFEPHRWKYKEECKPVVEAFERFKEKSQEQSITNDINKLQIV